MYAEAQTRMSDFTKINFEKNTPLTPSQYSALHQEDVAWLEETIEGIENTTPHKYIVVLSHHAPISCGVAGGEVKTEGADEIGGVVRVVSNQLGYPRESIEVTGFDSSFSLPLSPEGITLWTSVFRNDLERTSSLLSRDSSNINFRWYMQQTPLLCICSQISSENVKNKLKKWEEKREIVKLLLSVKDVEINAVDKNQCTALWYIEWGISQHGYCKNKEEIRLMLLESGALRDDTWEFPPSPHDTRRCHLQ
eukprot:TRINITY_DN4602_c0_g2_i1.p1 TRINITY_DN4602_c0_g2~~TRINITY_DN4602_c0_g2_i1.p1  ORF type:complete len:251 (+),score=65.25 TRINITY_DN4602_c0_g2_i1:223-975(+)